MVKWATKGLNKGFSEVIIEKCSVSTYGEPISKCSRILADKCSKLRFLKMTSVMLHLKTPISLLISHCPSHHLFKISEDVVSLMVGEFPNPETINRVLTDTISTWPFVPNWYLPSSKLVKNILFLRWTFLLKTSWRLQWPVLARSSCYSLNDTSKNQSMTASCSNEKTPNPRTVSSWIIETV